MPALRARRLREEVRELVDRSGWRSARRRSRPVRDAQAIDRTRAGLRDERSRDRATDPPDRRERRPTLDQLAAAAMDADHLGDLADHLVGHFVDAARSEGASWAMVGRSLGTTRQAAQQRFVAGDTSLDELHQPGGRRGPHRAERRPRAGHPSCRASTSSWACWPSGTGSPARRSRRPVRPRRPCADAIEVSLPGRRSARGLEHVPRRAPASARSLAPGHAGGRCGSGTATSAPSTCSSGLLESGDEPTVGLLTGLGASKDGVEDVDPQTPSRRGGSRA